MKYFLALALLVQKCAAWGSKNGQLYVGPVSSIYDEFEFIVDKNLDDLQNVRLADEIKSQLTSLVDHTKPTLEKIAKAGGAVNVNFVARKESRQLATDGLTSDDDEVYKNPNDNYEPSSNVENGAALSGVDFDVTQEYLTTVLIKPITLFCLGFVSLFFLNLGLCCRCRCCSCAPKKDITEQELSHQKMMITGIEVLLVFSVLLADTLCYYGYTYLQDGVSKLNDAFDGLITIFTNVKSASYELYTVDVPTLSLSIILARTSCPAGSGILDDMEDFNAALDTAGRSLYNAALNLVEYMEVGQDTVNYYVATYLRSFVFLIWAFAALATFWFVLFRILKSERGTKFAIFWGELTFLLIILFNVPMMILAQVLGDFCVQPTHNLIKAAPDQPFLNNRTAEDIVRFYSHCSGSDTIGDDLTAVQESFTLLSNATTVVADIFCSSDTNLGTISSTIISAGTRFTDIRDAIACTNFQAVWFTLFNDCLCGGIYSGIYSLWVSQFITSFFLFFLIVIVSVTYQYFHADHAKKVIPVAEAEEIEEGMQVPNSSELTSEGMKAPTSAELTSEKGGAPLENGDGGDVEMSEMIGEMDGDEII